jgi:hypothetical protein
MPVIMGDWLVLPQETNQYLMITNMIKTPVQFA